MRWCVSVEILQVIIYLGVLFLIKNIYYLEVDFGDKRSAFVSESAVKVEDCSLPDYEPFHPSVKTFLKNQTPINCGNLHFPLTFVDSSDRTIYVNASAVNELKKRNSSVDDVKCYYKGISRAFNKSQGHDVSVDFSEDEVILFNCAGSNYR
jgi:hypothetical protein